MSKVECKVCGKEWPNSGLAGACAKRHPDKEVTDAAWEQANGKGDAEQPETPVEVVKVEEDTNVLPDEENVPEEQPEQLPEEEPEPFPRLNEVLTIPPKHLPDEVKYLSEGTTVGFIVQGRIRGGCVVADSMEFVR